MATTVILPRQGQSVETCIITEWFKKKGDKVAIGDVLFSYETDKASFEEEAQAEVTEMLRISPSATLKGQRETMPFRDQAVLERYMGALRDAGVPEG